MRRKSIARAATLAVMALSIPVASNAQPEGAMRPTIILVHGAFAESASWNGVASELISHGYQVVAAANPLRSVHGDAAYVAALVRATRGPVVLVGHSYAGMVISEAANDNRNVKALVFVSAFAPEQGETASTLTSKMPGSTLGPTLAPPVPLPGGGKDLYIRQDKFPGQFAADVPRAQALAMGATQRPIAAAAFDDASSAPAWKQIPSWFAYGTLDKNIPPALQVFMAKRAKARAVRAVKGASHVVMISHPREVAAFIERAASAK